MINNAKQWATARNLIRKSAIHGAEEYKVPTEESFSFEDIRAKEIEGSGSVEVEDPDGTLVDFTGFDADSAVMQLGLYSILCIS